MQTRYVAPLFAGLIVLMVVACSATPTKVSPTLSPTDAIVDEGSVIDSTPTERGRTEKPESTPTSEAYPQQPDEMEEPTMMPYPQNGEQESEWIVNQARVESLRVNLMESLPVQVSVTVAGDHPDGCTELSHSVQTVTDHEIQLTVFSRRPRGAVCTQALVPFERTFSLDLAGLSAGEYTVNVNGVTETLVLEESMLAAPQ